MESRIKMNKDIFVEYYGKDRRIVEFMVFADKDAEDVLRELVKIIEQAGAKILELNSSVIEGKTRVFAFVDFSKAQVQPVAVLERLRKAGLKANLSTRNYGGYVVDQFGFPVTTAGGTFRVVVFPAELLSRTFKSLQKQLGGPGKSLLFHLGEQYGKIIFEEQVRILGLDEKSAVISLLDLYSSFGMGVVEIVHANWKKGEFRIHIWDNYESLYGGECDFTRGFLAGLFSGALNRRISVIETMCRFKGDPYCEFIVS